jgi:hypothetical protein
MSSRAGSTPNLSAAIEKRWSIISDFIIIQQYSSESIFSATKAKTAKDIFFAVFAFRPSN